MYRITMSGAQEETIFDPRDEDLNLISATIEFEVNSAGSATIEVPRTHSYYFGFLAMVQGYEPRTVTFYDDNEIIFKGHITDISRDIKENLTISIIGVLAELANVTRLPYDYSTYESWENVTTNNHVRWLFKHLIVDWYNNINDNFLADMVGTGFAGYNKTTFSIDSDRFTITNQKGSDSGVIFRSSEDYLNLWEVAENDFFGSNLGGYLYPTYNSDSVKICYEKNFSILSSQFITIGENLIDKVETQNRSEYITCIRPIGKDGTENVIIHGHGPGHLTEPYDKDEISDSGIYYYSEMLYNLSAIEKFGLHEEVVVFDDVLQSEVVSRLIPLGVSYLKNQTPQKSVEITGFDLGLIDSEIEKIRPFTHIRAILKPYGSVSETFNITRMSMDIINPQNTRFTLTSQILT